MDVLFQRVTDPFLLGTATYMSSVFWLASRPTATSPVEPPPATTVVKWRMETETVTNTVLVPVDQVNYVNHGIAILTVIASLIAVCLIRAYWNANVVQEVVTDQEVIADQEVDAEPDRRLQNRLAERDRTILEWGEAAQVLPSAAERLQEDTEKKAADLEGSQSRLQDLGGQQAKRIVELESNLKKLREEIQNLRRARTSGGNGKNNNTDDKDDDDDTDHGPGRGAGNEQQQQNVMPSGDTTVDSNAHLALQDTRSDGDEKDLTIQKLQDKVRKLRSDAAKHQADTKNKADEQRKEPEQLLHEALAEKDKYILDLKEDFRRDMAAAAEKQADTEEKGDRARHHLVQEAVDAAVDAKLQNAEDNHKSHVLALELEHEAAIEELEKRLSAQHAEHITQYASELEKLREEIQRLRGVRKGGGNGRKDGNDGNDDDDDDSDRGAGHGANNEQQQQIHALEKALQLAKDDHESTMKTAKADQQEQIQRLEMALRDAKDDHESTMKKVKSKHEAALAQAEEDSEAAQDVCIAEHDKLADERNAFWRENAKLKKDLDSANAELDRLRRSSIAPSDNTTVDVNPHPVAQDTRSDSERDAIDTDSEQILPFGAVDIALSGDTTVELNAHQVSQDTQSHGERDAINAGSEQIPPSSDVDIAPSGNTAVDSNPRPLSQDTQCDGERYAVHAVNVDSAQISPVSGEVDITPSSGTTVDWNAHPASQDMDNRSDGEEHANDPPSERSQDVSDDETEHVSGNEEVKKKRKRRHKAHPQKRAGWVRQGIALHQDHMKAGGRADAPYPGLDNGAIAESGEQKTREKHRREGWEESRLNPIAASAIQPSTQPVQEQISTGSQQTRPQPATPQPANLNASAQPFTFPAPAPQQGHNAPRLANPGAPTFPFPFPPPAPQQVFNAPRWPNPPVPTFPFPPPGTQQSLNASRWANPPAPTFSFAPPPPPEQGLNASMWAHLPAPISTVPPALPQQGLNVRAPGAPGITDTTQRNDGQAHMPGGGPARGGPRQGTPAWNQSGNHWPGHQGGPGRGRGGFGRRH